MAEYEHEHGNGNGDERIVRKGDPPYEVPGIDELRKGDSIPKAIMEQIVGCKAELRYFSLRCMIVCKQVQQALFDRGVLATVCMRKDSLVILDDDEAVTYHGSATRKHVRALSRNHAAMARIDTSKLDEATAKTQDRQLRLSAAILANIDAAIDRHRVKARPHSQRRQLE